MATPRKKPEDKLKVGRHSLYKEEYCDALIAHMREGGSFESFGANVLASKQTLYTWTEVHPEFLDAKKIGTQLSLKFYEGVAKMQALGQLKRVKSEKPMLDSNGFPMYDKNGNLLMEREYEPTQGSPATLIFMLKNMHGWRDKKDVNIAGQTDAPPVKFQFKSGLNKEQLKKRYDELIAKALKK
jgi:hypothetical protein